jgi:hypothetical protein
MFFERLVDKSDDDQNITVCSLAHRGSDTRIDVLNLSAAILYDSCYNSCDP